MHDLATLQRINNAVESTKEKKRARALNSGGKGHAKDAEKGRRMTICQLEKLAAKLKKKGRRMTICQLEKLAAKLKKDLGQGGAEFFLI